VLKTHRFGGGFFYGLVTLLQFDLMVMSEKGKPLS